MSLPLHWLIQNCYYLLKYLHCLTLNVPVLVKPLPMTCRVAVAKLNVPVVVLFKPRLLHLTATALT